LQFFGKYLITHFIETTLEFAWRHEKFNVNNKLRDREPPPHHPLIHINSQIEKLKPNQINRACDCATVATKQRL